MTQDHKKIIFLYNMDNDSEYGDNVPLVERFRNRKEKNARALRFATDQRSRDLRRQRMKNSGKTPKKSGKKVQG